MTLKCYIIDDEPLALALLKNYVEKTPFLELKGAFNSALQALEHLNNDSINLIFSDIQMPGINGMELSKILVQKNIKIIFTTAFQEYALESYKVNTIDYLLKPFSYTDFLKAAQKALDWFELHQKSKVSIESIFVKSEHKQIRINLNQILYIEGLKDYVKIYLENEQFPILTLMSLKNLEEILPKNQFMRVHRSYIVRGDKIKVIERNRLIFNKTYIPISPHLKNEFNIFLSSFGTINYE